MSLTIPPAGFSLYESTDTAPLNPQGIVVTSSGVHTKGSYSQLIASTAFDAYLVDIVFSDVGGTNAVATNTLVDIAIGAAASEEVIIPNLVAGYAAAGGSAGAGSGQRYRFPLMIPAGSRISARSQSQVSADTVRVWLATYGAPNRPVWAGSQVVDYGTNLATSQGVAVITGGAGAEGSWVEIVAATTQSHAYLAAGVGGNASTALNARTSFLDIGVGAATEAPIMENLYFTVFAAEAVSMLMPFAAFCQVASGTRLTARTHSSSGQDTYDVILYGVS